MNERKSGTKSPQQGYSQNIHELLHVLGERAKELNCLYRIEEILMQKERNIEDLLHEIAEAIPSGWQFPDICRARIRYGEAVYSSPDFRETPWMISTDITVQERVEGGIEVCYLTGVPHADEGPFLKEERKLLQTIADRISSHLLHRRLRNVFLELESAGPGDKSRSEWMIVLGVLRRTDQNLYTRISRKMLNHLCRIGVKEATTLLQSFSGTNPSEAADSVIGENRPRQREELHDFIITSDEIFIIASNYLSDQDILSNIQKWIKDDKASFLVNAVENLDTSLAEITDALGRFYHLFPDGLDVTPSTDKVLRVSLIRRLLSEDLDFINIAKAFIDIQDFHDLLQRVIYAQRSHGKLGGKSTGLYLASQILRKNTDREPLLRNIRIPKSWYIASDVILNFIHYNNLEEVFNQKYLDIDQIRDEYPHLVQVFKNSYFPPDIVKGLSMALDDLGDTPIIVRSSSLLEDSSSGAFSGKYKSLFLANTGTKSERLVALMDAIAEVYASIFGPDPIEYRTERGLLDFHEEMGVIIQEVVGTKIGKYFFPAFAGVAFSNNEFRWSPRIKREDGLIRMVPGLGTRAVDRLSDDYPILIAPGQPNLRVNISPEETVRYAPRNIDVINLETGMFETMDLRTLLRECGWMYPLIDKIVSIVDGDHVRAPVGSHIDFDRTQTAVSFDGLISSTPFVRQIHAMLRILQEKLGTPVDIEFASDGKNLYLLQCRPQSFTRHSAPAPIPRDISNHRKLFTANRYISNGSVPEITHIVYIDPTKYNELPERNDLLAVGRAVGRLNKLLPKRQFILMGPGRWGSRGDIKLGVNVTYSDINNTAVLIEVARKQGNYVPDLSFGTHFFQDLVEASIRYLPLYPDDPGVIFNEGFFLRMPNILADILPEFAYLADTIRVIDVPKCTDGMILRILMNADLEEAVGYLSPPSKSKPSDSNGHYPEPEQSDEHWSWRLRMAERIAAHLDPDRFGVKAMYVIGSTKNATAGPDSDIDLLVHLDGNPEQRRELELWLHGWSLCLAEINYLRTGYRSQGLLDVHYVTDEDIARRSSYAVKIDAVTDAARQLKLGKAKPRGTLKG
ncbi:MAG: PEP/pyruvate-binding domain-containing protein [Bacteroidota bacterium]|nr:PEP/pyruvate-binding domain-containing protein [Bacteroidota bacterium]